MFCEAMMKSPKSRGRMRSGLVAVALWAAAVLFQPLPVTAGSVPRPAPELTLKATGGEAVSLGDLKGSVVAVLWVSTDCPHCQETCEALGPIYREFSDQGLEILGMAVNPGAPGNIDSFKDRHNVEFPIGVSSRSDWMRFADLSVMARTYVPYLMLVDRTGTIRYEHRGRDQEFWSDQVNNLRKELGVLLAEPAGASR